MEGFVFIEILIPLFIISLRLMGIIGMQPSALRYSEAAFEQSIAITQLAAMAERLLSSHSSSARDFELQRCIAINTAYCLRHTAAISAVMKIILE